MKRSSRLFRINSDAPQEGASETERIDEYAKAEKSIEKMPSLETESGVLSIGGISKALKAPVKIAFYNQTKMITLMTLINDEDLMNRYAETAIRRTFGTPDEMKRAKPYPRQDQ